ncbi:hypothetical protein B0O99DRAFT_638010 [Bisporella sp. PMI_857]|nr:hypothetical protein B0O99DRAFT_638010 [Bisporella sp. PMI_857]
MWLTKLLPLLFSKLAIYTAVNTSLPASSAATGPLKCGAYFINLPPKLAILFVSTSLKTTHQHNPEVSLSNYIHPQPARRYPHFRGKPPKLGRSPHSL